MRDTLYSEEIGYIMRQLKAGKTWEQVRVSVPQVDPAALDANFKDALMAKAGVRPPEPTKPAVKPAAKSAKSDPLE